MKALKIYIDGGAAQSNLKIPSQLEHNILSM